MVTYKSPQKSTSMAAYAKIQAVAPTLRGQVYRFLLVKHEKKVGATDDEIQISLDMRGQTERPRRRELVDLGLVRDTGKTRLTEAGRDAVVWAICG